MSFWGYLWSTVWREANAVSRVIHGVAFTVPFVVAAAVSTFGGKWSKESWPAWVWLSITAAAIFFTFFISVTKRGYELAKEKEPKIIIKGIDVLGSVDI